MVIKSGSISPVGGARLASAVYDQLKLRILDGIYAPGQKLSVGELRSEVEVSKQPVMDALRWLAAVGLVRIQAEVGCWVRSYSQKDVEIFFTLIAGIEETITGLAAPQGKPEQLMALRNSWNWMRELPARYPVEELPRQNRLANREFHSIIHDMANSEILTSVSRPVWDLADFLHVVRKHVIFQEPHEKRLGDHEKILLALEAGDAEAARSAAREHMIHVGQMIAEAATDSAVLPSA